jgi:hypothetical protein
MGGNRSRKSENWKKSGYNATENRKPKNGTGNRKTEMWLQWAIFRFSDFRTRFSENRVFRKMWLQWAIFGSDFRKTGNFFRSNFSIGFFYRIPIFWDVLKGGPDRSFSDKKIFSKNDLTTPNFMRGIDCAHSRIVKMLPWPWFREGGGCIEAKIEKSSIFRRETGCIGVFLEGESIARIPEPWKRFLDPDSGKELVYWSENQTFRIFMRKPSILRFF